MVGVGVLAHAWDDACCSPVGSMQGLLVESLMACLMGYCEETNGLLVVLD